MAEPACDVLIFAEDPGAVNCLIELPDLLNRRGQTAVVLASGSAVARFSDAGVDFLPAPVDADEAARMLERLRPRVLLTGTGVNRRHAGVWLVAAARRRGIPSVGMVDIGGSEHVRFCGPTDDPRAFAPDLVLVPDAGCRDIFLSLGFDPASVVVCGSPHHDRIRRLGAELAGQDRAALRRRLFPEAANRFVVLFAADPLGGGIPGEHRRQSGYSLFGSGISDDRSIIVAEELQAAAQALSPPPYLVLKLHPRSRAADFAPVAAGFHQVVAGGDMAALAVAADLVCGLTSMALLEACLLGRPSLSIVPKPDERAWLSTIGMGLTPCAHDPAGIRDRLRAAMAGTMRPDPAILDRMFPPGSLERMADLVLGLALPQPGRNLH